MRNNNVARLDQIRDYLISLHAMLKLEKEGKAVLIYLDESYFNTTYSDTHLWDLSTGKPIRNKPTSRGRCFIFIRPIKRDGPLCDFDLIKGRPIGEIKWKGDTPHVNSPDIKNINEAAAPLPLTSKLIWIYYSYTGDYHNNMNGKMFMKWITTKVILLAAHNYPGVQMTPVMSNTPYHHVRSIPSLVSFSNKITFNLMKEPNINYVLLLLTYYQISLLPEQ